MIMGLICSPFFPLVKEEDSRPNAHDLIPYAERGKRTKMTTISIK